MKFVFANGKEVKCHGGTIVPATFKQTFELTVQTMGGMGTDRLKNLIQTKFKVTQIKELDAICVVQAVIY